MLMTALTIAGALLQAYGPPPTVPLAAPVTTTTVAAPAATPIGRSLKDLPNTSITYYDVQGKTGPAIEKSWRKLQKDPASKDAVQLFKWKVGAKVSKRTEGEKCAIQDAKSTLTAVVQLPRLAEEAKVSKAVLADWQRDIGAAESDAAAGLWFVTDQLRGLDQTMVGLSCDQATTSWNAGLEKLKLQVSEFISQRALKPVKID